MDISVVPMFCPDTSKLRREAFLLLRKEHSLLLEVRAQLRTNIWYTTSSQELLLGEISSAAAVASVSISQLKEMVTSVDTNTSSSAVTFGL